MSFRVGDRIYHRYTDLFGKIEAIDGGHATVRYEWPHDGKSTVCVSLTDLVFASDVA